MTTLRANSLKAPNERAFETLAGLAQAVTATLELSEVLDRVAEAATALVPNSAARIWVVEDDRLVLRSEAGTLGPPRLGRKTEFVFGEGLTGHVALTQEPLAVEDVLTDPRTVNVEWMRQEGYVSLLSIPLLVGGRLVGVLRGTTFKIYLPRVSEPGEVGEPGTAEAGLRHGSETVLLVEDEAEVRELARDILQENMYTVLDASHGEKALTVCERHTGPIHLLLTDVVMPQMSGRVLADRLGPRRPEMKALYMSGYTENAIVHHGVLDPGTAYLQKPFTPATLTRKVREVLDADRE